MEDEDTDHKNRQFKEDLKGGSLSDPDIFPHLIHINLLHIILPLQYFTQHHNMLRGRGGKATKRVMKEVAISITHLSSLSESMGTFIDQKGIDRD
ncbi:hypothetical protein QJS04_geneDACA001738 [Acorus gramineus]|uniref:Uncharacterized protein n=1 Tax=Acorus gramineus TaxID=55184 RepID=A0AAV9BJ17_ACOGR|nr:hypothetical protein QJS04_geneDACA001738 [Acorus gramineus]